MERDVGDLEWGWLMPHHTCTHHHLRVNDNADVQERGGLDGGWDHAEQDCAIAVFQHLHLDLCPSVHPAVSLPNIWVGDSLVV